MIQEKIIQIISSNDGIVYGLGGMGGLFQLVRPTTLEAQDGEMSEWIQIV